MTTALAGAHGGGASGLESMGTGQRSSFGSVLGSRSSRDRDMSDQAKTAAKHALPTPYADNRNHMVRVASPQSNPFGHPVS